MIESSLRVWTTSILTCLSLMKKHSVSSKHLESPKASTLCASLAVTRTMSPKLIKFRVFPLPSSSMSNNKSWEWMRILSSVSIKATRRTILTLLDLRSIWMSNSLQVAMELALSSDNCNPFKKRLVRASVPKRKLQRVITMLTRCSNSWMIVPSISNRSSGSSKLKVKSRQPLKRHSRSKCRDKVKIKEASRRAWQKPTTTLEKSLRSLISHFSRMSNFSHNWTRQHRTMRTWKPNLTTTNKKLVNCCRTRSRRSRNFLRFPLAKMKSIRS